MRRVRYRVAASLDGFIAGPKGEIDWIVPDPTVDLSRSTPVLIQSCLGAARPN